MKAVRILLLAILSFGIGTIWVRDSWAVCSLETAVFVCTIVFLALAVSRRLSVTLSPLPFLFVGVAICGLLQLALGATQVRAETRDAVLYWAAAGCLSFLGLQVCAPMTARIRFLKAALTIGATICIVGVVQLFTSEGRVFWVFASGYGDDVIGPFVSRNNYAAFVELLLPLPIVLSVKHRRGTMAYLVLTGALLASVIASGSRAGTAIALIETIAVVWLQIRRGEAPIDRRWFAFGGALVAFVLIAGHQVLLERFRSGQDLFQFRREFLQSSVAMLRDQPLHGFGLGTWRGVYRQYATIDTGFAVNHAHNEWVQWAAEGGLPVAALIVIAAVLCAGAAIRSLWGIGILAVFVHALLDYPFQRLGLAAWVFTMIGALSAYNQERGRLESGRRAPPPPAGMLARALCAAAIPLLLLASFEACRTAWADHLFRLATPTSVARASHLRPDRAEYAFAQSWTDREHSILHLQRAVSINPYQTEAAIPLASLLEARGDDSGAEAVLLDAASHDHQYAPAWALSNYYFRRGQLDHFWKWARTAAAIAPDHFDPLFDLCFAVTDDASDIVDRVVADRRRAQREFLRYLVARKRFDSAAFAAVRLSATATETERGPLLDYIDSALTNSRFDEAATVWNALCNRRLLPYEPVRGGGIIDADFRQPALARGFDWEPGPAGCATAAFTEIDGPALQIFLSPDRPDECEIYHQFVYLHPDRPRVLRFQYRTADLADPSGLYWTIGSQHGQDLASSRQWTEGEWRLPKTQGSGRLMFAYRRSPGSVRREGVIFLRNIRLD